MRADGVTVAVLTYRRPADLAAVVPAVLAQVGDLDVPVSVLVVDNDPDAGAREDAVVARAGVRYVHEPTPGIAAARNRALDEATTRLLVFLDDDERPGEGWLAGLVATYRSSGAAGVVGPVVSRFEVEPDPWLVEGGYFTRRRLPTGTAVRVAATNNLLLDLEQVGGLRFDARFGLTGGSDTLFTRTLTDGGGRLVWCDEAVVTDVVPAARTTRGWVVRRHYRMGNSASLVELAVAGTTGKRTAARARQLAQGLPRVAGGLARLAAGLVLRSRPRRAAGVRNLARGAGLIAGAVGVRYTEYRRSQPAR